MWQSITFPIAQCHAWTSLALVIMMSRRLKPDWQDTRQCERNEGLSENISKCITRFTNWNKQGHKAKYSACKRCTKNFDDELNLGSRREGQTLQKLSGSALSAFKASHRIFNWIQKLLRLLCLPDSALVSTVPVSFLFFWLSQLFMFCPFTTRASNQEQICVC